MRFPFFARNVQFMKSAGFETHPLRFRTSIRGSRFRYGGLKILLRYDNLNLIVCYKMIYLPVITACSISDTCHLMSAMPTATSTPRRSACSAPAETKWIQKTEQGRPEESSSLTCRRRACQEVRARFLTAPTKRKNVVEEEFLHSTHAQNLVYILFQ